MMPIPALGTIFFQIFGPPSHSVVNLTDTEKKRKIFFSISPALTKAEYEI